MYNVYFCTKNIILIGSRNKQKEIMQNKYGGFVKKMINFKYSCSLIYIKNCTFCLVTKCFYNNCL